VYSKSRALTYYSVPIRNWAKLKVLKIYHIETLLGRDFLYGEVGFSVRSLFILDVIKL